MRGLWAPLVGAVALLVGAPALADPAVGGLSAGGAVPALTFANGSGTGGRTYGSYSGVGSVIVAHQSGNSILCTGSLLSTQVVLTAGHCLSNVGTNGAVDPVSSVSFYLPSYSESSPASTFAGSSWTVNPGYTPQQFYAGNDLALFTLATAATGHDTYSIFTGDPLTSFVRVGTGMTGGAAGQGSDVPLDPMTGLPAYDFDQRSGTNLYEYYGNQIFVDVGPDVLMSDVDDGTAAHDVFGRLGLHSQTGIMGESDMAGGDSGGPTFIDGQIVGITSFGDSLGCNAGDADPYADNRGTCTNFSVGELAGDTWLSPYRSFIDGYIAGTVPEPSAWMEMIAGVVAIGAIQRRRARRSFRVGRAAK